MNCKNILLLFFLILTSCVNTQIKKENNLFISKNYFSNEGFALVYSDTLKKEKIISNKLDTRSLIIFQKMLYMKVKNSISIHLEVQVNQEVQILEKKYINFI